MQQYELSENKVRLFIVPKIGDQQAFVAMGNMGLKLGSLDAIALVSFVWRLLPTPAWLQSDYKSIRRR